MNSDLFSLKGRRALITGSTQGIGFTLACALADAGAICVLNGRDDSRVADAARQMKEKGHFAEQASFDVTDHDGSARCIDGIEENNGPIDILINNAGMQHRAPLEEFSYHDWSRLMDLNVTGVFNTSQAVVRHMIPRGRGKIINICSIQSALARQTIAPYTASKGAVANLTKGMCADWGQYNIQTNGIAPGYFATELNRDLVNDEVFSAWVSKRTPAGRWGQLEELSGAAVFLASDASNFVNGHILYVDGGMASSL